uniref:Uncharacterized protein n=1 Tax=viral metagenome TaxID=1070528 RepID=A0A6H1ZEK9_9ZZZZ
MDKLINKHVDNIEILENQLDLIIENEISKIDIDAILDNPKAELQRVIDIIKRIFLDEYADKAIELGFDFGRKMDKKIEDDKTILIDNSKDPKLNDKS